MRWRLALAVLAASNAVLADQTPLHNDEPPPTFRKTLVDVLSSDEDYTLLLKALQRARLVPTLNRINGSTLFAPTNDAIERYAKRHPDSAWAHVVDNKEGNPHIQLREHIFYHLLNYTASPTTSDSLPAAPATYTHRTLHFPRAPEDGDGEGGPPSREPPNVPPWMPLPGGLLAGEPQRVRVTWREDAAWVGVAAEAQGGVKVVKEDIEASNGRVVGVGEVLKLPPNLCELSYGFPLGGSFRELIFLLMSVHVIQHHKELKTLARYITPAIKRTLENTPHLTLFVPSDSAWESLKPMERLWLDSGFAERDLMDIFARHATIGEKPHEGFNEDVQVGWSEHWGSEITCTFAPHLHQALF